MICIQKDDKVTITEASMKKIPFILLIVSIAFGLTTTVSAKGKIGDIITNGDILEKKDTNGVILYFTDTNANEYKASIWSGEDITFGTVPRSVLTSQVAEYMSDSDYTINWGEYNSGPKKFFEYIENYSEYWKIREIGMENYYRSITYTLVPVSYTEPTFEIVCNPTQLSPGQVSECSLNVLYYSKLSNVIFKLSMDKYDIKDIRTGELFENLNIEEEIYSLTGKDSMEDSDDGVKTTVINFKIQVKDNEEIIDSANNVKVTSLNYQDSVSNHTIEEVSTTVGVNKDSNNNDNKETIQNPMTRNNFYYVLLVIGIALVSSLTIKKAKR